MRKLPILLLIVLGTLIGTSSKGAFVNQKEENNTTASPEKPSFRVGMYRASNALIMNVLVEKNQGSHVFVTLLSSKGKVLYREVLAKRRKNYWLKLNFTDIGDGTYSVVVSNHSEQITKSINLSTQNLYVMPARTLLVMN